MNPERKIEYIDRIVRFIENTLTSIHLSVEHIYYKIYPRQDGRVLSIDDLDAMFREELMNEFMKGIGVDRT